MTVYEFLEKNKITNYSIKNKLWSKVVVQALRHTTRSDMSLLYNIARPNEEDIYKKWRENNIRHVTVDFIISFERMLQRILSQTLVLDYNYDKLDRLIFNKLIPLSIQDPNAIILYWPYFEENPELSPSDPFFRQNQKIVSREEIIISNRIVEITDDILIYYKDDIELKQKGSNKKSKYKRYVAVDKIGYYYLTPFYNSKREVKYKQELWYIHGLDLLPIAKLPGINIYDNRDGEIIEYKESVCWPAFEWFDEGIIRMSSEQVASIKYANPKLIIGEPIVCPTCEGNGFVGPKDENGLIQIDKKKVCTTCKGQRTITSLGDFSTINIKTSNIPREGAKSNSIYYLEPPGGIKELQNSFMLFFNLGKKALTNDLLEGTGNESGIAKEMRLEPRQDLMQSYGEQLSYMIEDMINVKRLLEGEKNIVHIIPPPYYETKSPALMKEQITASLQGERYLAYMKWAESQYRGDEKKIKIHKYAALYAPLILYTATEFDSAFNSGVYDERDAVRRDYAYYAIEEVIRKNPDIEDIKSIKELADQLLIEQEILQEETKINEKITQTVDQLINTATTKEELPDDLDTAEEALTKYIHGELSRDLAIKILMITEGDTEEEAAYEVDNLKVGAKA